MSDEPDGDDENQEQGEETLSVNYAPSREFQFRIDFEQAPEGVIRLVDQLGHALADLIEAFRNLDADEEQNE